MPATGLCEKINFAVETVSLEKSIAESPQIFDAVNTTGMYFITHEQLSVIYENLLLNG